MPGLPGGASAERLATGQFRGMTLIRAMMDSVTFNAAGNELVMCKHGPAAVGNAQDSVPLRAD
jgi:hypothetical protein